MRYILGWGLYNWECAVDRFVVATVDAATCAQSSGARKLKSIKLWRRPKTATRVARACTNTARLAPCRKRSRTAADGGNGGGGGSHGNGDGDGACISVVATWWWWFLSSSALSPSWSCAHDPKQARAGSRCCVHRQPRTNGREGEEKTKKNNTNTRAMWSSHIHIHNPIGVCDDGAPRIYKYTDEHAPQPHQRHINIIVCADHNLHSHEPLTIYYICAHTT